MSKENHLFSLLSGLISDKLTPCENSELYQLTKDDGHKEEVMLWLQEEWAKELIQNKDEITGNALKPATDRRKRLFIIIQKRFLPYAAIFVLAFIFSWVIQKGVSTPDHSAMTSETLQQFNEIVVPYGSKAKVKLPDNSTVWLNSGARLRYPDHFKGYLREVFLQGEGFFDVYKDNQHPFIVNGNGINIKVHGTKFNLMVNADDNIIETTLIEGAIEILGLKDADKQSNVMMKPGQKLIIHKVNDQYQVHNTPEAGLLLPKEATKPAKVKGANLYEKANVELATAWTENKLMFSNERFSSVKTKLERWYGVTIEVKDPEILDYSFTGTFEKQTFEQAMNALSKAASCKFKIDKNHVKVSK